MDTPQEHVFDHHPYDRFLGKGSPMAFRLADARHRDVKVGDIVQMHDRPEFIQQQKFRVVARTEHPTIEQAVANIQHSNLSARDKIQLSNDFRSFHGLPSAPHPAPAVHFEFHPIGGAPTHI